MTPSAAPAPAYLPPNVNEARNLFHYATIFFIIAGVIWILWGVWSIVWPFALCPWCHYAWYAGVVTGSVIWGIICLVFGFLALIFRAMVIKELIGAIDQGRYQHAADKALLYTILGFIFAWVLGGVLMLLGYMKIKEAVTPRPATASQFCPTCGRPARYVPEYQQWYCDTCQRYLPAQQPPPAPQAPPAAPPPVQQPPPPPQQPPQTPPPQTPPPSP